MRDRLQRELRIYMQLLPLSEKEAITATQAVNTDPTPENITNLLQAATMYRTHVEIINFIVRMMDADE